MPKTMPTLAFTVAIPARYAAARLPGKPLRLLGGRPLVTHVVDRALEAGAEQVLLVTDDRRIAEAVAGQGIAVCMTSPDCPSGSDRIAEAARQLAWPDDRIVVNLQGDEPFTPPECIRAVAARVALGDCALATLATPITALEQIFEPSVVKVVCDSRGRALYFSRAPIPWQRDQFPGAAELKLGHPWRRHLGLYAYRVDALRAFTMLPESPLERLERLEQLRALEAGMVIAVADAPELMPPGIDTEADLLRAERHWASRP